MFICLVSNDIIYKIPVKRTLKFNGKFICLFVRALEKRNIKKKTNKTTNMDVIANEV